MKDILDTLVNPDDPKERRYKWDFELQQKVLGMLLLDKNFLVQSLNLIQPEYFVDKAHKHICQILFDLFNQYKQLPSKLIIVNELKEKLKNDKHILYYIGELEATTSNYLPGIQSREYLLNQIAEFAKEQAVYLAVSKTIDMVYKKGEERWQRIWDLWRSALTTDRNHDIGLDYFSDIENRYERMASAKKDKEIFTSGFDSIDNGLSGGGLCRGEMGAFMGLSGGGKSMALAHAVVKNLSWGKKVLYVTLEMNQDKIAQRIDAMLTGVAYKELVDNKNIVINALKEEVKGEEDKRRLIIKHFPGGTADVNTFRGYLNQASLYGFKPDLFVMDYMGELKDISGIKTYESRQILTRDLRTLGEEERHCTLTAMQANRKGKEDQEFKHIDDDALADAFGQARPLDALWSINRRQQVKIEYKGEKWYIGEVFVVKHRDGTSKFPVYYKQHADKLQMLEISEAEYKEISSMATKASRDIVSDSLQKKFKDI